MRVISGSAKGHNLFALDGTSTRPTTDRVKEALFSAIQFQLSDAYVLDLFAGSGALGIEALSRGARFCDFIELNSSAYQVILKNLHKTKLSHIAKVHNTSAFDFLRNVNQRYDIVFLDPPYNNKLCDAAMELISEYNLLNDGGFIVTETSSEEEIVCSFNVRKQYVYGKIKITVWVI